MSFISWMHLTLRHDQGQKERSILIKNQGKITIKIIFSDLNLSKFILCTAAMLNKVFVFLHILIHACNK